MEYKNIAKKSATFTGKTFWTLIKEFFLSFFHLFNPIGKLSRKYFIMTSVFCLAITGLGFLYFPLVGNYFPKIVDQVYLYSFLGFMGLIFINLQRKRIRDMGGTLWLLLVQIIPTHTMMVWHSFVFAESQSQHPDPTKELGYKPVGYTHPVSFWMRSYLFFLAFFILITGLALNDYITPFFYEFYVTTIENYKDLYMPLFNLMSETFQITFNDFLIFKVIYGTFLYTAIHAGIFLLSIFWMVTLRPPKKYEL
jgi:uncharacterized membrane protein YhaH (DUF805 family)